MAYNIGDVITLGNDAWTGYKPGVNQWNVSGQKANIKNIQGNNVDLDFTPYGGGTGWTTLDKIAGLYNTPAPSPTPAQAAPTATPRVDFAKQQQSSIDMARQKLIDYFKSLPSMQDRFNQFSDEQGLSQQQALVDALNREILSSSQRLENVDPNITSRAGNFAVTEAQRQGIVNRERKPIEDFLRATMQDAEYQGVGLQGKQNMVTQLMNFAAQDDQNKAKPYQIDVDGRVDAAKMLIDAFNSDTSASEAERQAALDRAQRLLEQQNSFSHDRDMENLDFQNSLKLKNSGGSSGGGSSRSQTLTNAKNTFTQLLANDNINSEYDVWKNLQDNKAKYEAEGTYSDLYNLWAALKADVGLDGPVRPGATPGDRYIGG